jgi:hypothetical protein
MDHYHVTQFQAPAKGTWLLPPIDVFDAVVLSDRSSEQHSAGS